AGHHGRQLDLVVLEPKHLVHRVDQETHDLVAAGDEQDPARLRRLGGRHPQAAAQIEDRRDAAAHREDAEDVRARPRHFGDRRQLEDLADRSERQREALAGQLEREELAHLFARAAALAARLGRRGRNDRVTPCDRPAHDAPPPSIARTSVLVSTSSRRAGASSTSTTRWSPRSVAPAKPRTSARLFPSGLMMMSCWPSSPETTSPRRR